jgi:glutamyl-tRNA reductase
MSPGSESRGETPAVQRYAGLALVGINHRVAPLSIRERLSLGASRLEGAISRCLRDGELAEVVLLSTCNRFEICGVAADPSADVVPHLVRLLSEINDVGIRDFEPFLYAHEGLAAVRHVLVVASSLDSMVVGETQILGQIRDAYQAAAAAGATGRTLNTLYQTALAVGKRVHAETRLGEGRLSAASVAVAHARYVLGSLEGRSVLVVGGGEMAAHAVCHLADAGASSIAIANRTFETAVSLASQVAGRAVRFERLEDEMTAADVVVCSLAAPKRLFGAAELTEIMKVRGGRPLFIVDIAVPRAVDDSARSVSGVRLVDIDDLEAEVSRSLEARRSEIEKAEAIVFGAVERFESEARAFASAGSIASLLALCHDLGGKELDRLFGRLPGLSPADREEVALTVRRVINKVLHHPIQAIKADPGAEAGAEDVISLFPMIDRIPVRRGPDGEPDKTAFRPS